DLGEIAQRQLARIPREPLRDLPPHEREFLLSHLCGDIEGGPEILQAALCPIEEVADPAANAMGQRPFGSRVELLLRLRRRRAAVAQRLPGAGGDREVNAERPSIGTEREYAAVPDEHDSAVDELHRTRAAREPGADAARGSSSAGSALREEKERGHELRD